MCAEKTQRYEYNVIPYGRIDTGLHTVLNQMAKSGWKLHEMTELGGSTEELVFQRPVAGGE